MSRRRAILIGAVLVIAVVVAVGLYLRFLRLPEGYVDPDTIPRGEIEAKAGAFRALANRLTSHVLSNEPFDVTFPEDAVNAYITHILARTGRAWYDEMDIPDEVEHVQVRFQPRAVVLFGRLDRGWATCVASVRVRVSINDEGNLEARVASVRAGRLPMPKAFAQRFVRAAGGKPFVVRLSGNRRARLTEVHLESGAIRLVGRSPN